MNITPHKNLTFTVAQFPCSDNDEAISDLKEDFPNVAELLLDQRFLSNNTLSYQGHLS